MNVQIVCISEEIYHSAFGRIIAVNNFESAAANASKLLYFVRCQHTNVNMFDG